MNTGILKDALRAKLGAVEYNIAFRHDGVILYARDHQFDLQLHYQSLEEIEQDAQAGLPKLMAVRDQLRREQKRGLWSTALSAIAAGIRDHGYLGDGSENWLQINGNGECVLHVDHDDEHLSLDELVKTLIPEPASV